MTTTYNQQGPQGFDCVIQSDEDLNMVKTKRDSLKLFLDTRTCLDGQKEDILKDMSTGSSVLRLIFNRAARQIEANNLDKLAKIHKIDMHLMEIYDQMTTQIALHHANAAIKSVATQYHVDISIQILNSLEALKKKCDESKTRVYEDTVKQLTKNSGDIASTIPGVKELREMYIGDSLNSTKSYMNTCQIFLEQATELIQQTVDKVKNNV